MRKTIKYILISILTICVLTIITIAIAINFVFTPEKLTPIVNKIAADYINSKVDIKKVDLTFFNTFPNFSIVIDSLTISQAIDSLPEFINVKNATVNFNPIAILDRNIVITKISLNNPEIYIYADSTGSSSFSVFDINATNNQNTDTTETDMSGYSLDISGVRLFSADIIIDDRTKNFYTAFTDLSFELDGNLNSIETKLKVKLGWEDLFVWSNEEMLIKSLRVNMDAQMSFNRDSLMLRISKANINVNGISMGLKGSLQGDSLNKCLYVDLGAGLATGSIGEFLNIIPTSIVKPNTKLKTAGSVLLIAIAKGTYSSKSMPNIEAKLNIENASAKYTTKKVSIEDLDCDAALQLNLNELHKSNLTVNNLHISSSKIVDVNLSCKVTNLLLSPNITFKTNSSIDFNKLVELFPLQDGVTLQGINTTTMSGSFKISDINRGDYGKINLDGKSTFNNLLIALNGSKLTENRDSSFLYLKMKEGVFLFGNDVKDVNLVRGQSSLAAEINFSGLGFRDNAGDYMFLNDIKLAANSKIKDNDSTDGFSTLYSEIVLGGLRTGRGDKLNINIAKSTVALDISPDKKEINKGLISAMLKTDSIFVSAVAQNDSSRLNLTQAGIGVTLTPPAVKGEKWGMGGKLGFSELTLYSDLFPVDIAMPSTELTFRNNMITLNNARLRVGHSDMVATGSIENLLGVMFEQKEAIINSNLAINSELIQLDQILHATSQSVIANAQEEKTDTLSQEENSLMLIPKNIKFNLDLNVKSITFGDLTAENVRGVANIFEGEMSLKAFDLEAVGAKLHTSVYYRNTSLTEAQTELTMDITDIDIARIGELIPSVDSLMPMLKSFKGIVDFSIVASSKLDKDLVFDMATLRSAMSLKGEKLVLMDSETFKTISKMLMFKNKQNNTIDSIGVDIIAENMKVEVLPFEVEIDRYRAIIGGEQTFDIGKSMNMNYKYNISIIKSPLPIKAGVDVFGNLNNFDFKITKAKLKRTDFTLQHNSFEEFRNSLTKTL